MTLAIYLAFLISQGKGTVYLADVLADWKDIEAFNAYVAQFAPYVISAAAIEQIRLGKKIQAIKAIRQEHYDKGLTLGLKEAKDIVDAYVAANPGKYNVGAGTYSY